VRPERLGKLEKMYSPHLEVKIHHRWPRELMQVGGEFHGSPAFTPK
jgi:hypothetical protein